MLDRTIHRLVATSCVVLAAGSASAQPLGTTFTYQAELRDAGNPASGPYDLRFRLYDAPTGGAQQGGILCADNIPLTAGRFTIDLDFGAQFSGQQLFLEIEVRADTGADCSNSSGFTLLAPRQPLTATPNAAFALSAANASTAANAIQLGGQPASFYTSAANITGTLPGGVLAGSYPNALTLSNASNSFNGSGAGLTNLDAGNISSGVLPPGRGGTGAATPSTALANLGGASLTSANTFTLGPQTFQTGSPGNMAVLVRGSAAQTANLQEWQTSLGQTLVSISGFGTLVNLLGRNAASSVLIVRAASGQSAPIQTWQDSAGNNLVSISNAGQINGTGSGLFNLNAANLATGLVPDARLDSNIPRLAAANAFSGSNTFSGSSTFSGTNTFSGANTFSAANNFSAPNTFSGSNTFSGAASFSDIVHSTASGYRFPDNTVQTTAALDPGDLGILSGYPAGTTVSITINGASFPTARMIGSWRIQKPSGGPPVWNTYPTLRRQRTSDNTWYDWTHNGTSLSGLVIAVNITGGAVTFTLPAGHAFTYRLNTGDDNLPFEEITYISGNSSIPTDISTVSGSPTGVVPPTVAPRLGASTGGPGSTTYRSVWGNIRSDSVSVIGNPAFTAPFDPSTGFQSGALGPATCSVRLNSLAGSLNLDGSLLTGTPRVFRLVTHPAAGPDVNCTNDATASFTFMTVRIADDGLPVEEYEVSFPMN